MVLNEADMNFNNFWVVTAGLGFPVSNSIEGRVAGEIDSPYSVMLTFSWFWK